MNEASRDDEKAPAKQVVRDSVVGGHVVQVSGTNGDVFVSLGAGQKERLSDPQSLRPRANHRSLAKRSAGRNC